VREAHTGTEAHGGTEARSRSPIYGLMAEFNDPNALVAATRRAREEGYRRLDAYTPYPIEELSEVLHLHHNKLPMIVLIGGLLGATLGYVMQYYIAVINYPTNIGGRPLHSWPAFIVVTFEMTILCASFAAFLGMLALNGLPMPYHPVFNVERFALATRSRFFLCIEATDPKFDREKTAEFLEGLDAREVSEVAH
jgi:Protein of unknown function (DUF3341)